MMAHLSNAESPLENPVKPEVGSVPGETGTDAQGATPSIPPGMNNDSLHEERITKRAEEKSEAQTVTAVPTGDRLQETTPSEQDVQPPAEETDNGAKKPTNDISTGVRIPLKIEIIDPNQKGAEDKKVKKRGRNNIFAFVDFIPRGKVNKLTSASHKPPPDTEKSDSKDKQASQPSSPKKKWSLIRNITKIVSPKSKSKAQGSKK